MISYASQDMDVSGHTVATVLLPTERLKVDAAGQGYFTVVHRETIPEAIRLVKERPVDAVLVSVHRCDESNADALTHLLREFPGVPTVALVSRHDPSAAEALLHFGANGVRRVVDVTSAVGWQVLRELVAEPASRASARIQGAVFPAMEDVPPDVRLFFEALIRLAPRIVTVRRLCDQLRVRPSTLVSRFSRAGLPSPKSYLAAVRLLHAAVLFDGTGLTVSDVAYRLDYSSPQSFGRHLRALLGITTAEFRSRLPFAAAAARFVSVMITPYRDVLRAFHPLAAGNWDSGRASDVPGGVISPRSKTRGAGNGP